MVFSVDDNTLKALISDLEMSFGKVEVIHETQFQNAALMTGMTPETIDQLSFDIGLRTAANHELPAVIVIEKLRERIQGAEMDVSAASAKESSNSGVFIRNIEEVKSVEEPVKSEPNSPESLPLTDTTSSSLDVSKQSNTSESTKYGTPESSLSQTSAAKLESLAEMSMIKITSGGYVGSFLDRHLVYSIEDQNRVINLDLGAARTVQVTRRFSDFVAVRDYLLAKYPFRCIPRLPAKRVQMFSDEAFLADRQKSLRRFLGILAHHHMYKSDPLVQAFIHNQKEYQNLLSDQKFTAADREHMLLTQIPSADALVHANTKEALNEIENSRAQLQILINFCVQTRDQIKTLIDIANRESTCLAKLSSTLLKSEGVTKCLCTVEKCEGCEGDHEMRKSLSSKLTAANESTGNSTIIEFEEIIEKVNLLIDLFESFNELVQRGKSCKHDDFDEIRKEIGSMEVEMEKKRAGPEGPEAADRVRLRIDALKQQWDEQDTFNKFIQYSVYDEMEWVHGHKIMMRHLLETLAKTITLKQRQWIATFEQK